MRRKSIPDVGDVQRAVESVKKVKCCCRRCVKKAIQYIHGGEDEDDSEFRCCRTTLHKESAAHQAPAPHKLLSDLQIFPQESGVASYDQD